MSSPDGSPPASVPLSIPGVTPFGKKAALDLADVRFAFGGVAGQFRPSEVPAELMSAEAERIAAIPDQASRASAILECVRFAVVLGSMGQRLGEEFAALADGLAVLAKQLAALEGSSNVRFRHLPPGSEGS